MLPARMSNRKSGGGCSAINCTMRRNTNLLSKVKTFRFPKDPVRRAAWRIAVRRANWTPTNSSVICNAHFVTGMPNSDPQHPDYVPSIFNFKQTSVKEDRKKFKHNEKNIKRGKHDSFNKNSDIDNAHYPRKCPLLKEKSTFRYTAVPIRCPPVTLSENSKEDERKENKTIRSHNFDTERSSKKSGFHQENTLKLSNGDIPRKNSSKYLDSEDDDTMCEPISLGGSVKNKQPISKGITDNESITDSEEDSELSLQETFFDPSTFSIPTGNPEEFLKRKLESVTELYEKSWKKMKMYQRKCKLYAKQSVALKEVIESLKQINSVPNDL